MGTSKNYEAPPQWGGVKREVTTTAGEGFLTREKAGKIVASFVERMGSAGRGGFEGGGASRLRERGGQRRGGGRGGGGGGGRHSRLARGGGAAAVARAVGSFLSDVAQRGLARALADAGITSLAGLSVEEVVLALADALGGPASTVDDVDLRNALSTLIDELSANAETLEAMEAALVGAAANLDGIIERLFGHYIYERFCTTMYANLAEQHGFATADSYLAQIKDYIDGQLALEAATRDLSGIDWAGEQGATIVDEILESTRAVFSVPA